VLALWRLSKCLYVPFCTRHHALAPSAAEPEFSDEVDNRTIVRIEVEMSLRLLRSGAVVFLLLSGTAIDGEGRRSQEASQQPCPVTQPNEVVADGGEPTKDSFGNSKLSVGPFGLWPEGTVILKPGGSGFITPEGWLGIKFGWQRSVHKRLTVEGRRLDGAAPTLLADSLDQTETGFQSTALIFPAAGCWEVTARAGDASITFITKVVKVGDGPSRRRSYEPDKSIVHIR